MAVLGCLGRNAVAASTVLAQGVTGTVRDETGGALPGVTVEAHAGTGAAKQTVSDPVEVIASICRRANTS